MAEIDTRPLESVQVALNLFEQRSDHSRFSSPDRNEQEIDVVRKELAACRLQLEAKENENRQANLRMEAMDKGMQEMSAKYDGACLEAYGRIAELESDVVAITSRQSRAASECEALRDELVAARGELDAVRRANAYVLGEVESMETRRILERESARDGLMRVLELNEAVLSSAVAAMRAEEERSVFFQEATLEMVSSGRNVEVVRRQKEAMESTEEELLAKTLEVDCLRSELKKLKEVVSTEIAGKDQEHEQNVALRHEEKAICLATEISREDDQVDGKMTEDFMQDKVGAEAGTVSESEPTAWQGNSDVADTYFDSELLGGLNVKYDDDGIQGSIHGSLPEHVVEGQEEPKMGDRFVEEGFKSVHSEYCKGDISAGIGMPEDLAGNRGSRPEGVTEIVVMNSKDGMPASKPKKGVRFLDETLKNMNSGDCKDMTAGMGMPENSAGKRRSELEAAGAVFVTEIVEVNSKDADRNGDSTTKEVVDTDKLGDGYVLVAEKVDGEALKDDKLDAAHAEISDLRFSLEEAVRRAELAEEAKAALERELRKEIEMKQRQPRPTEDAGKKCNLYAPPARPRSPAPPEGQRRVVKSVARPAPSCLTLGKVLNMKYR